MMTKLRERMTIVMVVLVFAFLGLMVFEWGMDYSSTNRQVNNVVGEVYDVEITRSQFQRALEVSYENMKNQLGSNPTDDQVRELRNSVWEQLVRRVIMLKEIEKRDITVSDAELEDAVKQNFMNYPELQTDGKFDEAKWQQAVANPNIPWLDIENQVREQLPFIKLQNMIRNNAVISEGEVEFTAKSELTEITVNQLSVNFREFSKSIDNVDSLEILSYYENNQSEFAKDESRKLNYVKYEVRPTSLDSMAIYNDADALKNRILNGENINALARIESDEPNASNSGGDLGWFGKGRMVKPFENAVFGADTGAVIGPVLTNFGYHVIKIDSVRNAGKDDVEYKASHILKKVEPSPETRDAIYAQASNFMEKAMASDFNEAANVLNVAYKTTRAFTAQSKFVPGLNQLQGAVSFAFSSEIDETTTILEQNDDYFILSLAEIDDNTIKPLSEVENQIKQKLRNEKSARLAMNFLEEKVKPMIESGSSFADVNNAGLAYKLTYSESRKVNLRNGIPGIGKDAEAVSQILNASENDIVGPLKGSYAVFYFKVLENKQPDEASLQARKAVVYERLKRSKESTYINKWFEEKWQAAEVKDYRAKLGLI
jgi:peptidyl-prolyl cis-trans isomerase D